MEEYLILARSVTYAQRMHRALMRMGIRAEIFRAPRDITDFGCAYVVRVSGKDIRQAYEILRREYTVRVFVHRAEGGFGEVFSQ